MDINLSHGGPAVTLDDLAFPILNSTSRGLLAFGKSDKQKDKKSNASSSRGPKSDRTLNLIPPPLPKVEEDRIQRNVAYAEVSKDISKWLPIVAHNRKAAMLSFPLHCASTATLTNATLAARFEPTTDLEKEIERLLKQGNGVASTQLVD